MLLNRAHIISPLILSLLLCSTSCNKDKAEFLTAEKAFNSGSISKADSLYSAFIVKYPASKFRIVAENQRDRCKSILALQKSAKVADEEKRYDEVINIYRQIAALNVNAIDTVTEFEKVTKKIAQKEAETKEKLENEFIENLRSDATALLVSGVWIVHFEKLDSTFTSDLVLSIYLNSMTKEENWYDPQGKIYALYSKAGSPPDKYKQCATILRNCIQAYYEFAHILNEFSQYTRSELRKKIKEKKDSFNTSFDKFWDCGTRVQERKSGYFK